MKHTSLKHSLNLALFGLALLPLLVAASFSAMLAIFNERDSLLQTYTRRTESVSREVGSYLEMLEGKLDSLNRFHEITKVAPPERANMFAILMAQQPAIFEVALLDELGRPLTHVSARSPVLTKDALSWLRRSDLETAARDRHPIMGKIDIDERTGEPEFALIQPLINLRSNTLEGYLVARSRMNQVWQIVGRHARGTPDASMIVDNAGLVIAHTNLSEVLKGSHYLPPAISSLGRGPNGDWSVIGVADLRVLGREFRAVNIVPVSTAFSGSIALVLTFVGISLLALVGATFLAVYLRMRILRPIDQLTEAAQAMADGDLERNIDARGATELVALGNSFIRMRDAIREKMADLAENNRQLKDEIGQRRSAEQERDRLTSVLEATTDLVSMADPQGRIIYLNRAGRSLLGIGVDAELTAVIAEVHPKWAGELILQEGLPAAIRDGVWSGETAILGKNGQEIPVSQVILSHKDATGKVQYMSTIIRDITERKLTVEKLRLNDERLRQAVRVSDMGIFDHDMIADTIYWSPEQRKIYGLGPDEVVTLQVFLDHVYPGDLERIGARVAMAHDPAGDGQFDIEHRIVRNDGAVRWISTRSRTMFEGEGKTRRPVRTIGAIVDITERKNAEESLRRLNEELESRVQERTSQLAASRDEAERANEAKSEFLSRMSHELRTPLNAILGFGQLLAMEPLESEQSDNVREILHAGQHLLDLINEVLDLARIESGKFTVSKEPVPLQSMIADCLTLIGPMAEARGIGILEAGLNCSEFVLADRTRLKQVLLNLLSNAVKYNRPKGSISVVCMLHGESLQIRITDTGLGLTAEQQARLFIAFERLDADQTAIEGTGIGLALSKRLVQLMDGTIGVESTPGNGSTFWVQLPIAAGHPNEQHHTQPASEARNTAGPISRLEWNILCIEDNPANLRLIERILGRREKINLLTASSPGLGLELARAHRPDLILLDINLPDMDGFAVMQCLRENDATRSIPVVAISANSMPKDLARGRAAGFADYLTKPLDVDRLLQVVDDAITKLANTDPRHGDSA
ncbi:MAG: ATP-binding protein [Gallionella sp.]